MINDIMYNRYSSMKLVDYCTVNYSCTSAHAISLVPPQSTINSLICEHSILMEHCSGFLTQITLKFYPALFLSFFYFWCLCFVITAALYLYCVFVSWEALLYRLCLLVPQCLLTNQNTIRRTQWEDTIFVVENNLSHRSIATITQCGSAVY